MILLARKSLKTSNTPPNNKCMDVMSAFVSIYGLEIHDVSNNMVFILDSIACNRAKFIKSYLDS